MTKPKQKKPKIVRVVLSLYPTEKSILEGYANQFCEGNESAAARVMIRQFATLYPQPTPLPLQEK